jgi:hypothetical protein
MSEEKKIDTAAILKTVAEVSAIFQKDLTPEERAALTTERRHVDSPPPAKYVAQSANAETEFEEDAAVDALETLAHQMETVIDRRMAKAYQEALRVYYIAEELAKDPAHAELIPHVEAMRKAHEKQYGKGIPPKPPEK